jgi:RNA polymerase sigma-70 factor (ECF subfamily)
MVVMSDTALMEGVCRYDAAALAEAHDRYYPAIFRFITLKVGSLQTAEDLTSDVFVRLLEAVRECKEPNKSLAGWLYCVASHVVSDYFRVKYRNPKEVILNEFVESGSVGTAEQVVNKLTLNELHSAMESLTCDQRKVIELRYGYEMSIKEVARKMGKSEGSVKQLQARAVASLAKTMAV